MQFLAGTTAKTANRASTASRKKRWWVGSTVTSARKDPGFSALLQGKAQWGVELQGKLLLQALPYQSQEHGSALLFRKDVSKAPLDTLTV